MSGEQPEGKAHLPGKSQTYREQQIWVKNSRSEFDGKRVPRRSSPTLFDNSITPATSRLASKPAFQQRQAACGFMILHLVAEGCSQQPSAGRRLELHRNGTEFLIRHERFSVNPGAVSALTRCAEPAGGRGARRGWRASRQRGARPGLIEWGRLQIPGGPRF